MFLLDTNVVSELRRTRQANGNVVAWVARRSVDSQFTSAMVLYELELGVQLMERRDRRQGAALRGWLDRNVVPSFAGRILPVDAAVARCCAGLHVPDPQPVRDSLIAATALVHGLTIVTRNVGDFAATGVSTLNPWDAPG